jgi:hypothetical protein
MVDPGSADHDLTLDDLAPEAHGELPIAKMMLRESYGAEAVRIRSIIRNPKLHDALQRAGKLV